MSETLSQLKEIIHWDENRLEDLEEFLRIVDTDEASDRTFSVFAHVNTRSGSSEIRLSYIDSASTLDNIPEVIVISRFDHTDNIAELIAGFFRVGGKRKSRVVKHHQID